MIGNNIITPSDLINPKIVVKSVKRGEKRHRTQTSLASHRDHLHVAHVAVCRRNSHVEYFATAARAIQQGVHVVEKIRQEIIS